MPKKIKLLVRTGAIACLALSFVDCGGGSTSSRVVTGIFVQPTPTNQVAYSQLAAPKNQVSFAAMLTYSDGSVGSPLQNVQWSDTDSWVFMHGSAVICNQPAPSVLEIPEFSVVTATAQVNGKTYSTSSGVYCL